MKIEASSENGKYKAKAETRISAPLQIINVDTTYISLRDYNSWVGGKPVYDNYLRLNIQLKQPDIEAENTYYRLEVKQIFILINGMTAGTLSVLTRLITIIIFMTPP